MGARDLLSALADSGLQVSLSSDGVRLIVRPASKLTDEARLALRAAKEEILAMLLARHQGINTQPAAGVPTRPAFRRLSPADADRCHLGGWSEAEILVFSRRRDRLLRWGRSEEEAENLAERLTLRDRDLDDRRTCVECQHLTELGSCHAALRGRQSNVGIAVDQPHRCESFRLEQDLD